MKWLSTFIKSNSILSHQLLNEFEEVERGSNTGDNCQTNSVNCRYVSPDDSGGLKLVERAGCPVN